MASYIWDSLFTCWSGKFNLTCVPRESKRRLVSSSVIWCLGRFRERAGMDGLGAVYFALWGIGIGVYQMHAWAWLLGYRSEMERNRMRWDGVIGWDMPKRSCFCHRDRDCWSWCILSYAGRRSNSHDWSSGVISLYRHTVSSEYKSNRAEISSP